MPTTSADSSSAATDPPAPRWDPEQQIYVGGVVPENAQVQELIDESGGYLRLFGYGSLCWNPGTGALAKPSVQATPGKAKGYRRCWAQKSTDHRGRPAFPGIVCTLLEDSEVTAIRRQARQAECESVEEETSTPPPTWTEGVIYLVPPDEVSECLDELDFREKGGYARDVIEVVEDSEDADGSAATPYKAVLYRGTPDNPAIWPRALLDLPFAAAVLSVSEGPSGKNDVYLNRLDDFLESTHTLAAEQDDTTALAKMVHDFQRTKNLYFLFGAGSNQHNQLLLDRPNHAAFLKNGEDAHDIKELVLCTPKSPNLEPNDTTTTPTTTAPNLPQKLFAGGGHSALLTKSGKLYLWGWNESCQLGCPKGHTTAPHSKEAALPISNPLEGIRVMDAALGFSHTLVIEKESHRVWSFGSNERGQVLGTTSTGIIGAPTIPNFLKGIEAQAVSAGLFHSAVVTLEGEVWVFGCSRFGQCLENSNASSPPSQQRWKPSDGSRIVGVTCGRRHTVAVDDQGRLWSWGENKYGQLGRALPEGTKKDCTPGLVEGWTPIPMDENTRINLDSGWSHTLVQVQNSDGTQTVYGWGRNDKGQLGLGTTEPTFRPKRLFEEVEETLSQVACGSESTMVVLTNGNIWGCGWNEQYV